MITLWRYLQDSHQSTPVSCGVSVTPLRPGVAALDTVLAEGANLATNIHFKHLVESLRDELYSEFK